MRKRLLRTLTGLLLLGFVFGPAVGAGIQGPADPTQTALKEARASIDAGNPAAAIAKLSPLAQDNDPRVVQMLGVAYYSANDHPAAVKQLSAVVEKFPAQSAERRESIQLLGLSNYILGRLEESIPYLEQTRVWLPQNHELAYALGMAYVQTRRPEKARESFARMFQVEPVSPAAHLLTAQMMMRMDMNDLAEAELKSALEKDAKLPGAHYALGQIAIAKAMYEEGIASMERELALNPGNANAYYKIGDAYTLQLKWSEAITALQKSIWLNPYFSGPYILLGKSYLKKREFSNAEGMLKRAVQLDPNNRMAHYLLAQVFQQTNRSADAKREFSVAERLQSGGDRTEKERP